MQKILHDNQGLLSWMPKMEKTTFDVSLVHFLLMFGYKMFSLFYPLYLVSVGISVMNVGSIYFLTYFVISVSCVVINFYIHKINPAKMAALGILGYGVFALMMLLSQNIFIFYLAQIVLGFSAAAWLVSLKFILMSSETENKTKSFAWFYAMPSYATAIAPAVGGAIIWKFGFQGVFFASLVIQFLNATYAFFCLRNNLDVSNYKKYKIVENKYSDQVKRYKEAFFILNGRKNVLLMLCFIFGALVLGGIYRAFFVLLLKDMSFSQDEIIKLTSALAFLYVPFSILVIKLMGKAHKQKIASIGMIAEGAASILLGVFYTALSVGAIFVLNILDSMGALALGSGKSAFFAKRLEKLREEASTIDSVMTTLGSALGGLLGGYAILFLGYRGTFFIAGILVFVAGIYSLSLKFGERKQKLLS
ncbi:MAG: MFS transporter [Candidatus Pacebacteria bacterium]|nr:MFS transporter [Candidatus Paceibacterota bacterium]